MEKKRKVMVLFCVYAVIIAVAIGVYISYLHDKPKIQAENLGQKDISQAT